LDENYSKYFKEDKPDLILDCVDSFGTRAIVNYFAVKYMIPLVSGGTNPSSGQVVAYVPGKSACLDCKLNVAKALARERTSHSCINAAQPSVIMTNEIIGGLMVSESMAILSKEYEPIRKTLKYDSKSDPRAGLIGGAAPCTCERDDLKKWMKDIIERYGEKKKDTE
jgi:molybdopterin/thiamine biosynthesis adenylyltransferase